MYPIVLILSEHDVLFISSDDDLVLTLNRPLRRSGKIPSIFDTDSKFSGASQVQVTSHKQQARIKMKTE